MDPEIFMHDREIFREKLLTWATTLNEGSVSDAARIEIAEALEEMVKDIEVLGRPPQLGTLLAEDFDLVEGSEDGERNYCEGYELIDPLVEAGCGRLCSKDGTIGDALSWAAGLLKSKHAPVSDLAIILDMLALHVGRLRLTRLSKGVLVDPYADQMDDTAKVQHNSNQRYGNEYLRAIWNRLYCCMDCNCNKCSMTADKLL